MKALVVRQSKSSVERLAALGGTPAFARPLCVGAPNVGDEDRFVERVRTILRSGRLSNDGPCVQELEAQIAAILQVGHCVLTCNGTIAISILFHALGLSGEVIVPAFTFIATAHAVRWHGLRPVFCDIDRETHNVDVADIERRITTRTTAIFGVHVWGRPCQVDALATLAREHRLHLIFDAAQAFGCSYRGEMIGSFGDAEVLSLHATKQINALEGGAITTNDAALAARLRRLRTFGMNAGEVEGLGINAKMNEVAAAMALTNLESVSEFRAVSHGNYKHYQRRLGGLPGVRVCTYDESERCNYHYVVLEIDRGVAGISRDHLMYVLARENVVARRYFAPGCHRLEPYLSEQAPSERCLPVTDGLCERVLVLPNGMNVDEDSVDTICDLIETAIEAGPDLTRRLSETVRRSTFSTVT